jgi:hypothetical protein
MKILLGDFNAIVNREDIFKPIIVNENLLEITGNKNGVRLANVVTSKNLRVKSTMFPHRNIHKYTWTPPDLKTRSHVRLEGLGALEISLFPVYGSFDVFICCIRFILLSGREKSHQQNPATIHVYSCNAIIT